MNDFNVLHQLIHLFKMKEDQQLERTGLSAKELYVLEHIREDNPWRFNDFAENYRIKPSTLTGIIERLEKKDLVSRQRDKADRKAVYLYITLQGKEIVKKHIEEDQLFFSSMLAGLDPHEKLQFISLVKRITESTRLSDSGN
jgi:DNA-binding MarR family transcriptional regulator